MQRALLAMGLMVGLASCSPMQTGMGTGDFGASLDMMQGHGSVSRAPDGSDAFTWVIAANAFDGAIPADQHEEQREYMLRRWIGNQDVCPRGYEITSRSEVNSALVYEGRCT